MNNTYEAFAAVAVFRELYEEQIHQLKLEKMNSEAHNKQQMDELKREMDNERNNSAELKRQIQIIQDDQEKRKEKEYRQLQRKRKMLLLFKIILFILDLCFVLCGKTYEDITISLVWVAKPVELFRKLESAGMKVRKAYDGIYYSECGFFF